VSDSCLIDLVSQRDAVRHRLTGKSKDEILLWLGARGRVAKIPTKGGPETFEFESATGLRAVFFVNGDELVLVGDHTTFI